MAPTSPATERLGAPGALLADLPNRSPRVVLRPATGERLSPDPPSAPVAFPTSPYPTLMRRWCPRAGQGSALFDERNGGRTLRARVGTVVVGDELDGQRARSRHRNIHDQRR